MRMRILRGGRAAVWGLVCLGAASAGAAACTRPRVEWQGYEMREVEEAPASFAGSAPAVLDAARAYPPPGGDRAAPVSLTASDGTGLELHELDARAEVLGPLALTELHLTFVNPEKRTLEGRFALSLPAGATVTRLALCDGDEWREAEVAPIGVGRAAHEASLHRRVDPVLAEIAPDGRLVARIFPIAEGGEKRLVVSYVHELRARGAPYRLPLAGLPRVAHLRVNVKVGTQVAHLEADDRVPEADFVTPTDGTGLPDGLAAGRLALVRLAPTVAGAPEPVDAVTILFDTSASRVWRFRRDVQRLGEVIAALDRRFGHALPLRVIAFDQTVETVFDGRVSAWNEAASTRLYERRPLGASNLAGALAHVATSGRRGHLLVWSDLVATAGATAPDELAALLAGAHVLDRVDVVLADDGRGRDALARRLVSGMAAHDGVVLHADQRADEIAGRLALRAVSGVEVTVAGARWVSPARLDGLQDGDETLVYAEMPPGADDAPPAALALTLSGPLAAHYDVALARGAPPLVDAAHAGARIASLEGHGEAARLELVRRSQESHVLTRATAFVVLDSDADYARLGISRRAPGALLVVGKNGLRVLPRRVAPQATWKVSPRARRVGSGEIAGTVIDRQTGAPITDVTVVATSTALVGATSELTTGLGNYRLQNLPAGDYRVDFYYGELKATDQVHVRADVVSRLDVTLDASAIDDEVSANHTHVITGQNTRVGLTADQGRAVPGRVFDGTITSGGMGGDPVEGVGGVDDSAAEPGALARADVPPDGADGDGEEPPAQPQDADDALAALVARHAARPDDPVSLRRLGAALERRGRGALAARVYGSLIDLYPGRADMLRVAGEWLEPLGGRSADLALDAYARALRERPDHATGYRIAAFALARRGRYADAFALEAGALARRFPAGRFAGFAEVVRQDLGVLAAAWAAAVPSQRRAIRARAAALGASLEETPSMRIVLTWETDASDVDLHVVDGEGHDASATSPTLPDFGGTLVADVATGYGPEAFVIDSPDGYPYTLRVEVNDRGATGLVLGRVQILRHDGLGGLSFDDRPFAAAAGQEQVALGRIELEPRAP